MSKDESAKYIHRHCLLRADLANYQSASNLAFNTKIKELQKSGHQIYHFGFGQSPFPVPDCMQSALCKYAHVHEYLSVQGLLELRARILALHQRDMNVTSMQHYSIDRMLVGAGSKELIFLVMNVFRGAVLLTSPSWTTYKPQTHLAGKPCHVVPTHFEDEFKIQPRVLEKIASEECLADEYKFLVLNSPSNPTGLIYSRAELVELVKICRRHKILVISDEIYARLTFESAEFCSVGEIYPEGTIITSGFSKWASLGGWRLGYALFPSSLHHLYTAVASAASHTYTCAPAPMQYAIADALEHEQELDTYAKHSAKILQAIAEFAHKCLGAVGVASHLSQAGYYFMPDFHVLKHRFKNGTELCDAMLKEINVALMPCDPHYLRPDEELTTRFCFVNFDGTNGLRESIKLGNKAKLDETFLRKHCAPTIEGLEKIAAWVQRNRLVQNGQ